MLLSAHACGDRSGLGGVHRRGARLTRVPPRRREKQGRGELTKLAKAAVIVRTLDAALLGVSVETLVAGRAVAVLGVPPALGHAAQVVLVQELTCVALLT